MLLIKVRLRTYVIILLISLIIWIKIVNSYLINVRYTWYYKYSYDQSSLHIQMNEKLKESQIYMNKWLRESTNKSPIESNVCTIIISSPRVNHPTLYYTLSSLLTSITKEEEGLMKLIIYNTARPSDLNGYAYKLFQSNLSSLKVINSLDVYSSYRSKVNMFKKVYHQWLWNETIDYLSSLTISNELNCSYLLILQDDLIFTKNFYSKFKSLLNNPLNCSSIRLFKTDYWDGWQISHTPFLLFLASFLSTLIILIHIFVDNYRFYRSKVYFKDFYQRLFNLSFYSTFLLLIFWFIWFFFVLFLLLSVNRQNFKSLFDKKEGLYVMETSSAGALAKVYPKWILSNLQEYLLKRLNETLKSKKIQPIDVILNGFSHENATKDLKECHFIPDLVDHIGVYSSSIKKNQGNFNSMKQSATFIDEQASINFTFH